MFEGAETQSHAGLEYILVLIFWGHHDIPE